MRPTRAQCGRGGRPQLARQPRPDTMAVPLGPATPGTGGQSREEVPGNVAKQVRADAAAADRGTAIPTAVGAYLLEIGPTPLLRPEEEVALAEWVARGDTEAAHALAQANLRHYPLQQLQPYLARPARYGTLEMTCTANSIGLSWMRAWKGGQRKAV
jgi:Sigma-70 factor, region 1.2